MKKETIIDKLDAMIVGHQELVTPVKVQAFRNTASVLKKLKQKHFVVRRVNDQYHIIRIV